MDAEELSASIAEAMEQYLGIEDISIEDERTLAFQVDGERWQLRLKPLTKLNEDQDEDEDEGGNG